MSNDKQKSTTEFAELLDSKFRIPGTKIRFGFDPVIGLIPGAGDILAGVVSLYFLIQAAFFGGNALVLGRMFINILLDVLIGSIPVFGEVFDVYWKANLRNARILEELQEHPEKATTESRLWVWFVVIQLIIILVGIIILIAWAVAELIELIF